MTGKLVYPSVSMTALVEQTADRYPSVCAYEFFGKRTSYAVLMRQIRHTVRALRALGVTRGDRVTVCMPNTPQALLVIYALGALGAVANMVHPLSGEEEIAHYVNAAQSRIALTVDAVYPKFRAVRHKTALDTVIVTSVGDALSPLKRVGYALTEARRIPSVKAEHGVLLWRDFLRGAATCTDDAFVPVTGDDTAVILYSGGTTGAPKGVLLTHRNLNALALQTGAAGDCVSVGYRMLAVMPIFHGFGLGVCVHTALVHGATCVLVPRFYAATYAKLLRRTKPHYIAGVPTLYEAMLRDPRMTRVDLSRLQGVFCGGDTLSPSLKRRVDAFLQAHGAAVQVREGYGATECVNASCLTPKDCYKEGSIGVPFPDTLFKIVRPDTEESLACGETGEICISGPTVMQGYMDDADETARVLRTHTDGRVWLHTGDLGKIDEEGFVYFYQRLKRVIVTGGYNVYPAQVEAALSKHPSVQACAVIGVADAYRGQTVKAFVVPVSDAAADAALTRELTEHCARYVARYAVPRTIVFCKTLPLTAVGKVDHAALEQQEKAGQTE